MDSSNVTEKEEKTNTCLMINYEENKINYFKSKFSYIELLPIYKELYDESRKSRNTIFISKKTIFSIQNKNKKSYRGNRTS